MSDLWRISNERGVREETWDPDDDSGQRNATRNLAEAEQVMATASIWQESLWVSAQLAGVCTWDYDGRGARVKPVIRGEWFNIVAGDDGLIFRDQRYRNIHDLFANVLMKKTTLGHCDVDLEKGTMLGHITRERRKAYAF